MTNLSGSDLPGSTPGSAPGSTPDSDPTPTTGALQPADLQQRAARGSLWTLVHVAVSLPLAFLANVVIARSLGTDGYGQLAFLMAALGVVSAIANLGVSNAAIQAAASADTAARRAETETLLRRTLGFHLAVQVPVTLAAVLLLARDEPRWVIALLTISIVLGGWMSSSVLALTAENRTDVAAKVSLLVSTVTSVVTAAVAAATGRAAAVWSSRLIVGALAFPAFVAAGTPGRRRRLLVPMAPAGFPPGFWRFALTSGAAGLVATLVFSRSEVLLLEWLGTATGLGLFALAFGLSVHLTAPAEALLGPLLPAAAGLVTSHPERVTEAYGRATRLSSFLAGAVAALAVPPLVVLLPWLYGDDFAAAQWLLVALTVVSVIRIVTLPATAFLNARRLGGTLLRANVLALAGGTAVAVALIPPLDAWGAAIGNAVGQLVAIGVLVEAERRRQQLPRTWLLPQVSGLLVGLVAMSVALLAVAALPAPAAVGAALGVLVAVLVFLLLARLVPVPVLQAGDVDAVLAVLPARFHAVARRLMRTLGVAV